MADRKLLVVCGLAAEAAIAAGERCTAVAAPPSALEGRLRRLDRDAPQGEGFDAVVSFGLAGGLDPALAVGDLVVASEVVRIGSVSRTCDPALSLALTTRLAAVGIDAARGRLAASDAPVASVADKIAFTRRTHAVAVDTESHLAADFAARHALPFATLRVICDTADRDLPPLAATAVGPDGRLDFRTIGRELVAQPRQLAQLPATALATARAFATLRRVRRLLGPGFGLLG